MSFDRSEFKGATVDQVTQETKRTQEAVPVVDYQSNRADFHKIVEGKNVRRVAPSLDKGKSPYRGCTSTTLECEVPEVDSDGKETGTIVLRKKKIFIAPQHSKVVKDDPIILYIEFVTKKADDKYPKDRKERDKYLGHVNGYRGPQGWVWGIRPQTEFICYSWDSTGKLGRDNLYPSMMDGIKKLSADMADPSKPYIADIFTDPDEGYNLVISKEKNDKGDKFEYSVSCEQLGRNETWETFFARTRVTDEMLVDLAEKESLGTLYDDVYSQRDFNMAVNGLQLFDAKHKYGVFEDERFLKRLSEIKTTVPEFVSKYNKENSPDPVKAINKTEKPVETKVETKQVEETKTPPAAQVPEEKPLPSSQAPVAIFKVKKEIRDYVTTNYGAEYIINLDIPETEVRSLYELVKQGEELPGVHEAGTIPEPPKPAEPVKPIQAEVVVEKPMATAPTPAPAPVPVANPESTVSNSMKEQIEALRKRRQEQLDKAKNGG